MQHSIVRRFLVLMVGITIISHRAWTQPLSQIPLPPHIWGAASNGICGGLRVRQNDLYCDIDVRNMTTNRLYIWVPRLDRRYEIEFQGPDGQRVPQLKPFFPNINSMSMRSHWLGREPCSQDPLSEKRDLNWFYLKDTFDVRTNGLHTLIVSVRVNAFTNFGIGSYQMRREPSYFLLPPVTNTFNILPEQLKK
jgi:hypothetical protein